MSGEFTITVEAVEAQRMLAKLGALDMPKALRAVSREMEQQLRQTFRDEADPWGRAWPPHSPVTIRNRERRGNTRRSLLFDTGAMYSSIRPESDATTASVSMGGTAEVHQFGTTTAGRGHKVTIPARPTFPIDANGASPDEDWWDAITAPVDAMVEEAIA